MKKLEGQQIVIICIAAAFIPAFAFFHYPLAVQKKTLKKAANDNMLETRQVLAKVEQLPILCRQQQKLRETVGNFEKKIPVGRSFSPLWQQINGIMEQSGLKDRLIQPENETESEEIICIPVTIKGSGKLSQMFDFFKKIQNIERLINFRQLQISNDNELTGSLTMHAKVDIYYRPQQRNEGNNAAEPE